MFMTFGKHKGSHIKDIPSDYLYWVLHEATAAPFWLKVAIQRELSNRDGAFCRAEDAQQQPHPARMGEVVNSWYRTLSLQYHPDRGGSDAEMRVVHRAREVLTGLLQEASR